MSIRTSHSGPASELVTGGSGTGTYSGDDVDWDTSPIGGGVVPPDTYELTHEGGQSVIFAHGSMGATETFDPTDGNVHTGTLNANCTFTLSAPSGTGACTLELRLTQDGTGGRTITWPGSVTVIGTLTTTASTSSIVILETLDGGTTWVAVVVGGSSVAALDDLTDVTITTPLSGDRLRYNGSAWVNANLHDEPMIATDGTVMTDGLLNPMMHEVAW